MMHKSQFQKFTLMTGFVVQGHIYLFIYYIYKYTHMHIFQISLYIKYIYI